jgi:DNA-directed RNA polymerase III subunit RPC3
MRAVLKASESKQLTLSDSISGQSLPQYRFPDPNSQCTSDPVSVADIATALPSSSTHLLSAGLITSSSKPSTMALIRDYLGLLSSADNPTPAGRAASFLSFSGTKTQVEFGLLAQSLQLRVIDSLTRERHGDAGLRVLRLLRKEGKMSEATIGKTAMLAPKDVRPLLSAMAAEGLVAMQEVPKSADRNPSRMFYLWYVDPQKTAMGVLGQMYKVLFNIGRRRVGESESGLVRAVLEKRRRSDVEEDVGLLSRNEREVLEEYEGRCERLTVLEMRVEEAVFVLRDLGALITYEK